jgi:hypothetical protein
LCHTTKISSCTYRNNMASIEEDERYCYKI